MRKSSFVCKACVTTDGRFFKHQEQQNIYTQCLTIFLPPAPFVKSSRRRKDFRSCGTVLSYLHAFQNDGNCLDSNLLGDVFGVSISASSTYCIPTLSAGVVPADFPGQQLLFRRFSSSKRLCARSTRPHASGRIMKEGPLVRISAF